MKIVPISEPICENQEFAKYEENSFEEGSSQDLDTFHTFDNISFLTTQILMDEIIQIIDLESH